MKVLMILTSHGDLGKTGEKTGFWIEEFASPYYTLSDAGVQITLASPKGGQPPIDPKSDEPGAQTDSTLRFKNDEALKQRLANTVKLSGVKAIDYDAVFYPGGHGPLWDLANDPNSIRLLEDFYILGKPIALVCHAPGALVKAKAPDGQPLAKNKEVTGFSNEEEQIIGLEHIVPFSLEDELKKIGAHYSKGENWEPYAKKDGLLITGQNPASSQEVADVLLEVLSPKAKEFEMQA